MNKALQMGYQTIATHHNFDGWQSMDTAPRDGTWVELKSTYGVAPWYCIARWTDEWMAHDQHGRMFTGKSDHPSWTKSNRGGFSDENSLHWRPYAGEVASYIDPTGGFQNDAAYWRGAVARKYGLQMDAFEEMAEHNAKRNENHGSQKTNLTGPVVGICVGLVVFLSVIAAIIGSQTMAMVAMMVGFFSLPVLGLMAFE